MEKLYTIFAALSDESNEGWVWFKCPCLPTRTIVKVKVRNVGKGREVFCQARMLDANFLDQYNGKGHTKAITNPCETLVISEWYRNALGGFAPGDQIIVDITPAKAPWRALRAACHHPDIVARVGTRLGVLGAWLGLVGLTPALLDLFDFAKCVKAAALALVAVLGAILGWAASRGVRFPA